MYLNDEIYEEISRDDRDRLGEIGRTVAAIACVLVEKEIYTQEEFRNAKARIDHYYDQIEAEAMDRFRKENPGLAFFESLLKGIKQP